MYSAAQARNLVSSCDSSVLNLSPSHADSFSKHISLFFFFNINFSISVAYSFNTESYVHFPWFLCLCSLLRLLLSYVSLVLLSSYFIFVGKFTFFCALACMITSVASLLSCLNSAYLCSLILCALQFLGNAKLFYSRVPYRFCHYGELLFIRKVQYE